MWELIDKILTVLKAGLPLPSNWLDDTQVAEWLKRLGITSPLADALLALTPEQKVAVGESVAGLGSQVRGLFELRRAGLSLFDITPAMRAALADDPTLRDRRRELAEATAGKLRLQAGDPAGITWDDIIALIEALIPLILMIIDLFSKTE